MSRIVLIVHNVRSCHNVGSLLRTAEGVGIDCVYLTGYTPYPITKNDQRLPHIAKKAAKAISKTALGAEKTQKWQYEAAVFKLLDKLKAQDWTIAALEQTPKSIKLPSYSPPAKIALIVGREVEGVEAEVIDAADICLEIPMHGKKESFNVAQAAAIALYHCKFFIS